MDIPPNKTLYVKNVSDKIKKDPLKRQLYLAFGAYGRVIDVVAMKGESLRGQAWIVFDDVGSATTALRSLQGFPFFGKPLRISFAKSKSDALAIREGNFEPNSKRQKREKEQAKAGGRGERAAATEKGTEGGKLPEMAPTGSISSVLMAQDLPAEVTDQMLGVLFGRFGGFKEIRMAGQRGIAFIEFRDEVSARTAFQAYNGFKISPTDTLKLTYAKR